MNRLRDLIRSGRPALGTWLSLASPNVADVLGRSGFDWLLIDGQHSPVGPAEAFELARTVVSSGASPVLRVGGLDPAAINQALDAGAHGLMIPSVATPEEAERAVALATYPPGGERSIGGYRAQHAFGMTRGDYLALGAAALLAIQVESGLAVKRIDEILAVEGVDVCFVGPQDLAASLGLTPRLDSTEPAYQSALETIIAAAVRRGTALGILTGTLEGAIALRQRGFTMIAVSTDARLLEVSARDTTLAFAEALKR